MKITYMYMYMYFSAGVTDTNINIVGHNREDVFRIEWIALDMHIINSLRPSDAYMRQWNNHHWFR